jgi:hypothetical protein
MAAVEPIGSLAFAVNGQKTAIKALIPIYEPRFFTD